MSRTLKAVGREDLKAELKAAAPDRVADLFYQRLGEVLASAEASAPQRRSRRGGVSPVWAQAASSALVVIRGKAVRDTLLQKLIARSRSWPATIRLMLFRNYFKSM